MPSGVWERFQIGSQIKDTYMNICESKQKKSRREGRLSYNGLQEHAIFVDYEKESYHTPF